ncbi:hypothetical protein STEG23_032104, partial [Scotinomys teguina]
MKKLLACGLAGPSLDPSYELPIVVKHTGDAATWDKRFTTACLEKNCQDHHVTRKHRQSRAYVYKCDNKKCDSSAPFGRNSVVTVQEGPRERNSILVATHKESPLGGCYGNHQFLDIRTEISKHLQLDRGQDVEIQMHGANLVVPEGEHGSKQRSLMTEKSTINDPESMDAITDCQDFTFCGVEPASEPETRVVSNLRESKKRDIPCFLTVHSCGQLILTPYGYTKNKPSNYREL